MNTNYHRRLAKLVGLLAFIVASHALAAQDLPPGTGGGQGPTNTTCPVMPEEAVDPSFSTEYEGRTVYFCCRRCVLRFEQNPENYAQSLAQVMPITGPQAGRDGSAPGLARSHGVGPHDQAQALDALEPRDDHDGAGHDHASDHGVSLLDRLGRLHVVVVHFPIALLILGAALELAGLMHARWTSAATVRVLAATGALSAVAAMVLGLLHGSANDYSGTLSWVFLWHRGLGIAVAVTALVAWFAVESRARKGGRGGFAAAALLLSALLVGAAGHFGGSLVYGWEYLLP